MDSPTTNLPGTETGTGGVTVDSPGERMTEEATETGRERGRGSLPKRGQGSTSHPGVSQLTMERRTLLSQAVFLAELSPWILSRRKKKWRRS